MQVCLKSMMSLDVVNKAFQLNLLASEFQNDAELCGGEF